MRLVITGYSDNGYWVTHETVDTGDEDGFRSHCYD